jgi:lipid-binding SYLF domain-containing protein
MFRCIHRIFSFAVIASLALTVPAEAASKGEIEAGVETTLGRFYSEVSDGKNLVKDAKGVLVFPAVFKGGIGIGGEYGEGALQIKGKTAEYYSTAAASLGLQLGVQKKSIVILFMQDGALSEFRNSSGWKAGVDASIAVVKVGAGGAMDTSKLNEPILGFIIGQAGLMYNLTLEGAKFSKIEK